MKLVTVTLTGGPTNKQTPANNAEHLYYFLVIIQLEKQLKFTRPSLNKVYYHYN